MNEPEQLNKAVRSDSDVQITTTHSSSICTVANLMFSLTLGILALQTASMALHQLPAVRVLNSYPVIPIASLFWTVLAVSLIFTLRLSLTPVSQAAVIAAHRVALRAAGFLIAGKFVLFELGKLRHNAEMEQFFRVSGYPICLHYIVVALELIGAAGVLLPIRRIRSSSAAGLLAIMGAAVVTQMHNGDPLRDSYDALLQALYLIVFLVLSGSSGAPFTSQIPSKARGDESSHH